MIKLTLPEVIDAISGDVRGEIPPVSVAGVCTDSRAVTPDALFFAIRGDRFDGHAFVCEALEGGALAAVVAREQREAVFGATRAIRAATPRKTLIGVDDPVAALGRLAHYHRRQLPSQVIAVVGSNGKTTTKAMIDHVLSSRLKGRSSPKSFNNAVGVPLTLLSASPVDEYVVVEIGTNRPGEIAALARIAEPDMAVITCVAEEHLEGLGDLVGVAAEECSILGALRAAGFAAANIDSPELREHLSMARVTLATFGRAPDADLRLTSTQYSDPWLRFTVNARFAYQIRMAGMHNAVNALGAITIARRFGFSHEEIASRLESFESPPMRHERVQIAGVTILNDAYNANPSSTFAALETLRSLPCHGRRFIVFGEMRELGSKSADLHRQVANKLIEGGFDRVLLVGEAGKLIYDDLNASSLFGPAVTTCADVAACADRLADELRDGDLVLLKASRAVGLERVIEPLRVRLEAAAHPV